MKRLTLIVLLAGAFTAAQAANKPGAAGTPAKTAVPPTTPGAVPVKATVPVSAPDRVAGTVDLVVSGLAIVSNEVRFRVRNQGLAVKPPGRINYELTVTNYAISPPDVVISTRTFTGIAGITTLSRLGPGQETGEDRVTGHVLGIAENARLQLCINRDQRVAEGNFNNNCLVRTTRQVLPDLAVIDGRLNIYKPKKEDPWYKKVGDFLLDVVTGFEFDPSGLGSQDHVQVTIRNNGGVPVVNYDVTVGISGGGGPSRTYKHTFTDPLAPGVRRTIAVYVHQDNKRWSNAGCCTVTAMVDADQRVRESDEGNNKRALPTARVRDHRN